MVAAILLSLTSKILITIATPAFVAAYKRSDVIWGAQKDLEALRGTIKAIQAKLDDAAKMQQINADTKDWMDRIGDVLHEADDLFDEVAANQLLKQQIKGNKLLKEVKVSFSKFNPVISNHSIAKKVESIRQQLEEISNDVAFPAPVEIKHHQNEEQKQSSGPGWYRNSIGIVGRDEDQRTVCNFLLDKTNVIGKETVPIIAIVGMGGMGKTTVAQLICSDEKVQKEFKKVWWASVTNMVSETEVLLKIFQSIKGQSYGGDMSQLSSQISNLVRTTRDDPRSYLLILDDVCDRNLFIWHNIISLLSDGAKGSKIVVTARYQMVADAMQATKTCCLQGLSERKSWELFRKIAFQVGQESDCRKINLGSDIVNKCANNPLAIKSIATLLCSKPDIDFWQSVKDDPNLQCEGDDSIMSRLSLSFYHLPQDVKPCFAYCSLFPRQYKLVKEELIYLWIAQGYVKPKANENIESVGNGYFNELLGRNFFQDLERDKHGEIITCKMHDLFHQLAQQVAGEQTVVLTEQWNTFHQRIRHLTVGYVTSNSWTIPESLLISERLRSSLFTHRGILSGPVLNQLLTEFKFLRALDLEDLKVDKVSDSVGDLKHLRYLNLSENTFTTLPSSISKLVNLLTLDISRCVQLKSLPDDFRKLISLRVLNAKGCRSLTRMPPRLRELPSLEYMSYFNVGEGTGGHKSSSMLDKLKLRRNAHKDRDEAHLLPKTVSVLEIENPTMKMQYWPRTNADIPILFPNLVKLHIFNSQTINDLPPFRCLSSLKDLQLSKLEQLQYFEDKSATTEAGSIALFFPNLERLALETLPSLEGWLRGVTEMPQFPKLFNLRIEDCQKLKSIPQSVCLQTLELRFVTDELVQQMLPAKGSPSTSDTPSSLTALTIWSCQRSSLHFEFLTSLQCLQLECCYRLNNLYLAPKENNMLQELQIQNCPNLESYGHDNTDMDWGNLPELRVLRRDGIEMQKDDLNHGLSFRVLERNMSRP